MSDQLARALVRCLFDALQADSGLVDELRLLLEMDRAAHANLDAAAAAPIAYTTAMLAAVLGITDRAVRGAIDRGELDATKRGRRWVIDRASVERYVAASPRSDRQPAASKPPRIARRTMADALVRLTEER